jgi:hypothetical protein
VEISVPDSLRRIVVCLALLSSAAPAAAQVKGGEFRLFVDMDLVTYERTTIEKVGSRDVESALEFGPGGSGLNGGNVESTAALPGYVGLGFGYAVHRRFVPAFHFSVARRQSLHEVYVNNTGQPSVQEPTVLTFMLRPELEVLLNPGDRAVVAALAGFDVRRSHITAPATAANGNDPYVRELTALGPVAGVVGHFFVVKKASLDMGVVAVIDFIRARGDGPNTGSANYRDVVISLTMGLSLWP